jgi:hypothetical protein
VRKLGAALAAAAIAAVVLAGCSGPSPPSPVAVLPKLLVDYQNNTTKLYLTSVNADVRYDNLTLRLSDANNSTDLVFHSSKSYALVAETNHTFFVINASVDEGETHYFYNATWHLALAPPPQPGSGPVYQIYIRETVNGPIQTEAVPYRHLLA